MTLQLNDNGPFKEYYGRNVEQMPKLVKDGRVPLSVAGLMQRRLEVLTASEEVKSAYWDNYFGTSDAILYHPNGKVKVALDSSDLLGITPESTSWNWALVLPDGAYDIAKGVEFSRDDIKIGTALTLEEAITHPVWRILSRGNDALLKEYMTEAFKQGKERARYDTAVTGVYLRSTPKQSILEPCFVEWAHFCSALASNGSLGNGHGCLVGVFPEGHRDSYTKQVNRHE